MSTLQKPKVILHVKVASKLDVIYALSASWGESEAQEDFEMLEKKLTAWKPDELILVSGQALFLCTAWVILLLLSS